MPEKNKLANFPRKQVVKAFAQLSKKNKKGESKVTVADVAAQFDVHPSTIRYHMTEGTYARGA